MSFDRLREEIIDAMCFTYRPDFDLIRYSDKYYQQCPFQQGVTEAEQANIRARMALIFDKHISPNMTFNKILEEQDRDCKIDYEFSER